MILVGHQPNYLPYLGFIEKISKANIYAIFDTTQLVLKHDAYHNRNLIKTSSGPHWLTVPVLHKDKRFQRICDTVIDNSKNWSTKHWRSILFSYSKAPYFNSYSDFFQRTYSQKWNRLAILNEHIIKYLLKEFKVNVEIIKVSELDVDGKNTDLIINVCKKVGVDRYLSGRNGIKYMELSKMKEAGIQVLFQDFKHPMYEQQYQHLGFRPNLSCLDMLFNCGESSIEILREANPTDIQSLAR